MDPRQYLSPLDTTRLSQACAKATPFPHICIDRFLRPDFASEVAASYPSFDSALGLGKVFRALNEDRKIQITDVERLPQPARLLNEILASSEFRGILTDITRIEHLLADRTLSGGGIHLMASGARLDVHVDFNALKSPLLFRRLNILIFLNERWKEDWGGELELWDRHVKRLVASFVPTFNRCIVFATSEISFHGVRRVTCPKDRARKSFAAYYYTREAPEGWDGKHHSTIFKARPDEWFRGTFLMPASRVSRATRRQWRRLASRLDRG